jgi:hypothetical protein
MRILVRTAALVALALAPAACADLATAPGAPLPAGSSRGLLTPVLEPVLGPVVGAVDAALPAHVVPGLTRNVPLERDVVFRFQVQSGGSGTSVAVPGTGLKIDVPSGALPQGTKSMVITVTAKAGDMVAYDFQPHGTQFAKPITLTQTVRGTSYERLSNKAAVEAGYFADPLELNELTNTATVTEFLPAAPELNGTHLKVDVHHFSGYMLSSGRTR